MARTPLSFRPWDRVGANQMRHFAIPALALVLAACGGSNDGGPSSAEPAETVSETPIPVEPDGGIGDGAAPPSASTSGTLPQTMPEAMRGDWHKNVLGRAPTSEECDPRLRGTVDWDRLITVRENGYGYFELGGRIIEVHNRSASTIDATFDTTYADTPTSERRNFALNRDDTLIINLDDNGDGVVEVAEYLRCPKG